MKFGKLYESRTSIGLAGLMGVMLVVLLLTNGIDTVNNQLGVLFPVFVLAPLLVVVLSVIADIEKKPVIRATSAAVLFVAFAFLSMYGMIMTLDADVQAQEVTELVGDADFWSNTAGEEVASAK